MFIVAPSGTTKIGGGVRLRRAGRAVWMVIGITAEELEVEKASSNVAAGRLQEGQGIDLWRPPPR